MEFIDHTGHVFSLQTFDDDPIALKYKEQDYIFWLKDDEASINNYYIKPIRFILNRNVLNEDSFTIEITLDSQFYRLISPKLIQNKIEQNESLLDKIEITFDTECKTQLTNEDFYLEDTNNLLIVTGSNNIEYVMFPFYVIGRSNVEGTYISNIMIKTYDIAETKYTPISIGCTFIDECEELIINGRNMGIKLPKEIIKAIYEVPFDSKHAEEKILKTKMKELLLNYMSIKGECGNFKSVYHSLKWFGWGNYISISKLIKTDNEFQDQYILDYFDVDNDLKHTFELFKSTNMISLSVKENTETGKLDKQNFDATFIGEGKPLMEDLFNKTVEVIYDDISFYKPYYRYMFCELALKLDCLRYYYQQYFLPVHIKINRASITRKVYANTIKLLGETYTMNTADPIYVPSKDIYVEFPKSHELMFYKSEHFIDDQFNEFSNYNESYNGDLYYINENCVKLPIKIIDYSNLYVEDVYGDYVYIYSDITETGSYKKIYSYFIFDEDDESFEITDDKYFATHFILGKNNEPIDFNNLNDKSYRCSKLSKEYFSCLIILSSIKKQQSDFGKYVYIDGSYIKPKYFYDSNNEENIEGNYIYYNNEKIWVNNEDRYDIEFNIIVKDNYFEFYQEPSCYYSQYIILPKYWTKLGKNIDWLNEEFRFSILVNNKWFNYDFTIKIPNIYLEFGKIEYKYYLYDNYSNTLFNQILYKTDDDIKFSSFMYQPDLVSINTLFYDEYNDNILTFLGKLISDCSKNGQPDEEKIYNFYNQYFRRQIEIPYNKNYINQIHLFNLYKNNVKFEYDENLYNPLKNANFTRNLAQLYNEFFDEFNEFKIKLNELIPYDAYLMHDPIKNGEKSYWYIVLISKFPIAIYDKDIRQLDIINRKYTLGNYTIKYSGQSVQKFLINRMNIIPTNGKNEFTQNSLIAVGVYNNDYQFNIDLVNKWNIQKVYNPYNVDKVVSNTNLMIIPNNNYNGYYDKGYYNVDLEYTVDGLNHYNQHIKAIFKVTDKLDVYNYIVVDHDYHINIENFVISDFKILYEYNDNNSSHNGKLFTSKKILPKSKGYVPIAIKIVNENYFTNGSQDTSPDIYMGLKWLDTRHFTGYEEDDGKWINQKFRPYFGFSDVTIPNLKQFYNRISLNPNNPESGNYFPENNLSTVKYVFTQTDNNLHNGSVYKQLQINVPNDRIFYTKLTAKSYTLNLLNDDDSLNTYLLDENCAANDWNGKQNTQILLNQSNINWQNINSESELSKINKLTATNYSTVAIYSYKYHTKHTNSGQWHIPAFAEVFFTTFNYKKLNKTIQQLYKEYGPKYCNLGLLEISNSIGIWTSTAANYKYQYDIHPYYGLIHSVSKRNYWATIPFIHPTTYGNIQITDLDINN